MSTKNPTHILYMEDDETQARLFKRVIGHVDNYHIDVAADGAEGLAMYRAGSYDVLIIDQRMPIYDGLAVMRILSEEATPLPPIIMVTAAGNEKLAVEAMKLGASDYIVKDSTTGYLKLLPAVIEQALQRQQLLREKQLAEKKNARLSAILEATTDFVGISDPDGRLLELNRAGRDMLGLSPGEDVSEMMLLDCFTPEARQLIQQQSLQTAIEQGSWQGETVLQGPKGQEIPVSHVLLAHKSRDGRLEFISSVARDISERKMIERTLRESQEVLEQRVAQRTAALHQRTEELLATNVHLEQQIIERERVETELRKLVDELDTFAQTVAHDLKGPLALMLGFAELLEEDHTVFSPAQLKNSLRSIAKSGRKMKKIIEELLLLAGVRKMEAIPREPLDMNTIVVEALNRQLKLIDDRHAAIVLPPTWPIAVGYGPWIEEVWANYISNAIKYGGDPPVLELGGTMLADGMIRFWVRDNGDGITPEDQTRLFKPFSQLKNGDMQGHGLGLSIVQRIVQRLDGEVMVESDGIPGEGSVFSFTLPTADLDSLPESVDTRTHAGV